MGEKTKKIIGRGAVGTYKHTQKHAYMYNIRTLYVRYICFTMVPK